MSRLLLFGAGSERRSARQPFEAIRNGGVKVRSLFTYFLQRRNRRTVLMGERKRKTQVIVYHHASTLREHLIILDGKIMPEGSCGSCIHPAFGEVQSDQQIRTLRRTMSDFPGLVWFTSHLEIPQVLQVEPTFINPKTGEPVPVDVSLPRWALGLHRIALGFDRAEIGLVPWPEYCGYFTPEGRYLNDVAISAGDDPDDWWISETPIDLGKLKTYHWSSRLENPILLRDDDRKARILLGYRQVRAVAEAGLPAMFFPTYMKDDRFMSALGPEKWAALKDRTVAHAQQHLKRFGSATDPEPAQQRNPPSP